MLEGTVASRFGKNLFDEKEVFKIVKRHAFWGSLLMAIPDAGFGTIFYICVLWRMYSKIAKFCNLSFAENFWKLAGIGFIINIIIAGVIDVALTAFFFIEPFIIYAQFYLSGKLYVESLKKLC